MTRPRPFVFTRWFGDWQICMGWLMHFRDKRIPAGIVRRSSYPNYAVWVHGIEAQGDAKRGNLVTVDRILPNMQIQEECNGFGEIFTKFQKEAQDGRAHRNEVEGRGKVPAGVAAGLA